MKRVMFVCKHNSGRSQMAEAFAKNLAQGNLEVVSAGLEASRVHPGAVAAMQAVGIDISQQVSKPLSNFKPEDFDVVVSLCGCGVNLPPAWLLREVFEDWQLDDPAERPEIFPQVRDQVRERVEQLLQRIAAA